MLININCVKIVILERILLFGIVIRHPAVAAEDFQLLGRERTRDRGGGVLRDVTLGAHAGNDGGDGRRREAETQSRARQRLPVAEGGGPRGGSRDPRQARIYPSISRVAASTAVDRPSVVMIPFSRSSSERPRRSPLIA